jgi:tRNA(Leu) C34 or U34 (ribose-2'-O)-methylase TrmL
VSGDTKLKPLIIDPGIDRNITTYQARGKWVDCDKVRFSHGNPEKIGGWAKLAEKSIDYKKFKSKKPILFIVGSEVEGMSREMLKLCDSIVEITMLGNKESLNVSVAFGVAIYRLLNI